jgi:hypothetical protein
MWRKRDLPTIPRRVPKEMGDAPLMSRCVRAAPTDSAWWVWPRGTMARRRLSVVWICRAARPGYGGSGWRACGQRNEIYNYPAPRARTRGEGVNSIPRRHRGAATSLYADGVAMVRRL